MRRFYAEASVVILATAFALAMLLAVTACSPASQPEETPTLPACASVWVEGSTLPANYGGCMDGDSLVVSISDSAGAVVYDDRFAAKPGQPIAKVGGQG